MYLPGSLEFKEAKKVVLRQSGLNLLGLAKECKVQMNTEDGGRCECLLVMYTALWEDRSLVTSQLSVNLCVEAIFHDEPSLELTVYNSKKLVGAVVHVRYVEPAGCENGDNTGDTDGFEDREVVYGGKEDGTTISTRRRFLVIEIED